MFRKSSLLVIALGLAAIGAPLFPAGAMISVRPASSSLRPASSVVTRSAPMAIPLGQASHLSIIGKVGPLGIKAVPKLLPKPCFKCPPPGKIGANVPAPPPPATPTPTPPPLHPKHAMWPGQKSPFGGTSPGGIFAAPVAVDAGPFLNPSSATLPAVAGPNGPAPMAATEPCNCLTKQYLDDGSVLFRDICTKEAAVAARPRETRSRVLSNRQSNQADPESTRGSLYPRIRTFRTGKDR